MSSLFNLVLAGFLGGLGIGYTKFFLLSYLSDRVYGLDSKGWVIQLVGAIITIGPAAMYALAGPLSATFYKRSVMLFSGLFIASILLIGAISSWAGSAWLYALLAGLAIGVFNPARNASVPLEASSSGRSAESVNAWLNNSYIAGLLAGVPAGTSMYSLGAELGAVPLVVVFAAAAFFGGRCRFPIEGTHLKTFKKSLTELLSESREVLTAYGHFLVSSSLFWGMGGALSLAVTAYAEQSRLAGPVLCSLMSAYAAIGVVVGNALAPFLARHRYRTAVICAVIQIIVVLSVPAVVQLLPRSNVAQIRIYWIISALIMLEGTLFGLATNLIEAEYFRRIFAQRREGTGSALLSAMTALFAFLLGGFIGLAIIEGLVTAETQFLILAAVNLVAGVILVRLALIEKRRTPKC